MTDYTHDGAIPDLTDNSVLGVPTLKSKSQSNVQKLALVLLIVIGFALIMVGTLLFLKKNKEKKVAKEIAAVVIDKNSTDNKVIENFNMAEKKAAIKNAEEAERLRQEKAIEDALRRAERDALKNQPIKRHAANDEPKPPTREEMQLDGSVLFELPEATTKIVRATSAGTSPHAALAGIQQKGVLESRMESSVMEARNAGMLSNLDFLLKKTTVIPCVLKTGIDSTLPGFVSCVVQNDVYSANNKTLLIERGSTIIGEQKQAVMQGQERIFILWAEINTPTGAFISIDSPASDAMGYSGIPGYVDTHFWKRFGGAIMLSLIQDTMSAVIAEQSKDGGTTVNNTTNTGQTMAEEALKNSINIPPTLTVLPGTVVNVMVARHVSFESIYEIIK